MTDKQFQSLISVLQKIELNTSNIASDISTISLAVNTSKDLDAIYEQLAEVIQTLKGR